MSGSNSSVPGAAAPAEPVDLTVVSLPDPGAAIDAERRRGGRRRMFVLMAVCAAPVVASYLAYYVLRPAALSAYGTLIQPTVAMPDLALRDADDAPRRLSALKGQWLIVTVDGAACGAACDRRLFMQRQLREMLGRERDRVDKLWLVLDDVPLKPALRSALAATEAMHVLRAPREAVAAWLKPAPGQALEDHLYIVDPMGEWMMREPAAADPAKVKRDLDRLLRASAGWDRPGR
ncbi:MAG: hypothetical protein HY021_15355 [Burkholderiales bacterium]|nr:hypothetical protein [Burkholderiales bacterium]